MPLPSLLALAAFLATAVPTAPQQPPTFPARVELVTVDVVVTDREGRPISGLTRADFVLEEDGSVQEILEFEAVDLSSTAAPQAAEPGAGLIVTNAPGEGPGRQFLVVFDALNLSPASGEAARDALRSFLSVQLREGDQVTVTSTGNRAAWTGRIAEDLDDLAAFLGRLKGRRVLDTSPQRMSDVEAMRIHVERDEEALDHVVLRLGAHGLLTPGRGVDPEDGEQELQSARSATRGVVQAMAGDVYQQAREKTRQVLSALEAQITSLPRRRGRRAVVLASEGFLHDRTLDEHDRVQEAASRANAALYFLDAGGLRAPEVVPMDMPVHPDPTNLFSYASLAAAYAAEGRAGSEALADDTGGLTIRGNDLAAGLRRLGHESRTFYLLGYEPSKRRQDGRFRKIKVQVRRPGVVIRARKGYHAAGPPSAKAGAADARPALSGLQGLLERSDVPLRLAVYVLGAAAEGRTTVLLSAEADPGAVVLAEKDGRVLGALDSFASVASRDTGEVATAERLHELSLRPDVRRRMDVSWVPVTHSFELPPGRYQATLAVRDRANERAGSVRQAFDVPAPRTLRITTPILSDTLLPPKDADSVASPAPLARRRFALGARLFCRFEVAGVGSGSPTVLLTHEIVRSDGTLVTRTKPTPLAPGPDGARVSSFSMTLNRPGRYELRVFARDEGSGEEASALQGFEVDGPS